MTTKAITILLELQAVFRVVKDLADSESRPQCNSFFYIEYTGSLFSL